MPGPLNGLKVIDITTVIMGPFATQIMAEMGADVIKIETEGGDSIRGIEPARHSGMGWMFMQANRGKRSVVLDLKSPTGRDLLMDLVKTADIVITNMRPAALRRLKLTYDELARANPRVIFATLFGYDERGPQAGKPAFDDLIQGAVGLPALVETAGGKEPRYVPLTISDRVVGLYGLSSILAALWSREQTGMGQTVEVPMFESMAHFVLGDHIGGGLFDPPAGPMGYPRVLSEHRRPYKTKDGYVCTMIYNDQQWRRLFSALGRLEIFENDPRFANLSSRTKHIDEILQMISGFMADRTTDECVALLEAADLPVSRLNTMESLLRDPQLEATGFFKQLEHPTEGTLRAPGNPVRFSHTPNGDIRPAPRLGEHTEEVIAELDQIRLGDASRLRQRADRP